MTLIQSVLTSIPIYFFSFFRVPKNVMDKLVSIQRKFLWGGAHEHNKIAWVKWDTVCLPKENGGLGIKDINAFNLALLGKWKWNLLQHQGELWARVLESKYGGWRSLNEAPRANTESIWWRDLKLLSNHPQHSEAMQDTIVWKVGKGDKFRFWEDNWIGGDASLSAKYPRLYAISCQQNQIIQQMGDCKDTGWEWNLRWRRPLFDSEINLAVSFLKDVDCKSIQPQYED